MTGAVQDNQLKYASVLKVVANGGNVKAQGDKLVVSGADDLTFYVAAATDYKNDYPVYRTGESDAELLARVQKTADDAVARGYDAVRADHVEDFSALMNRVDLDWALTARCPSAPPTTCSPRIAIRPRPRPSAVSSRPCCSSTAAISRWVLPARTRSCPVTCRACGTTSTTRSGRPTTT